MSRTVIALVDDMFFASKIRATAEAMGVSVSFPRSKEALLEKLASNPPDLVIADLHNQRMDVVELGRELKSHHNGVPLLGFFSHVEVELQRNALSAGFDQVIPRSVFARDLGEILGRSNEG
jgi:CheY-like chemotaxis protein